MLCVNKVMSLWLWESFDITSKMAATHCFFLNISDPNKNPSWFPIYPVTNEHSMELAFMYFAPQIKWTCNIQ